MKKFLLILSVLLIINPAMAKNVKVEALSGFSTANPSQTWKLKVKESFVMEDGTMVRANTIVEGKVVEVEGPKSLKRNKAWCKHSAPSLCFFQNFGEGAETPEEFAGILRRWCVAPPCFFVKKRVPQKSI